MRGRVTMGRGAKGVSNLLIEAVAGRNMSMKNTHSGRGMQTNKPQYVQLITERRGQAGHHLDRNVLERSLTGIKRTK